LVSFLDAHPSCPSFLPACLSACLPACLPFNLPASAFLLAFLACTNISYWTRSLLYWHFLTELVLYSPDIPCWTPSYCTENAYWRNGVQISAVWLVGGLRIILCYFSAVQGPGVPVFTL
jgi:hypothetical protein